MTRGSAPGDFGASFEKSAGDDQLADQQLRFFFFFAMSFFECW